MYENGCTHKNGHRLKAVYRSIDISPWFGGWEFDHWKCVRLWCTYTNDQYSNHVTAQHGQYTEHLTSCPL